MKRELFALSALDGAQQGLSRGRRGPEGRGRRVGNGPRASSTAERPEGTCPRGPPRLRSPPPSPLIPGPPLLVTGKGCRDRDRQHPAWAARNFLGNPFSKAVASTSCPPAWEASGALFPRAAVPSVRFGFLRPLHSGELWLRVATGAPSLPCGSPALCCHPALGRKLPYSPELMPMSLVGMGALGLEISLGGAAATVASRIIPVIAQGFCCLSTRDTGPGRTWEVFTKWPVSITDSAVCAGRGLQFGQFVPREKHCSLYL